MIKSDRLQLVLKSIDKVFEDNGKQDFPAIHGFGRYYPKPAAGDFNIDWNCTSLFIHNKIRARSPNMPGIVFLEKDWSEFHIWDSALSDVEDYISPVGQVIDRHETKGNLVKTSDNAIWIKFISKPGQEPFTPRFPIGTCFIANWMNEAIKLKDRIERLEDALLNEGEK